MTIWLLSLALAQDTLTLPVGRVAVLAPQQAPTEVAISAPKVIDVQAVMPWLMVYGKAAGTATLGMAHEGGRHEWAVTVASDPATKVEGGSLLQAVTQPVPLALDGGVLLPFPDDGTALAVVKPDVAQASLFGEDWLWVQGDKVGVTDVVIERGEELPQLLTVTVGASGPVPPDAAAEGERMMLAEGGEATLSFPTKPVAMLVAHRGRIEATHHPDRPGQVRVKALRDGRSYAVFGFSDGSVVVRPAVVSAPTAD